MCIFPSNLHIPNSSSMINATFCSNHSNDLRGVYEHVIYSYITVGGVVLMHAASKEKFVDYFLMRMGMTEYSKMNRTCSPFQTIVGRNDSR